MKTIKFLAIAVAMMASVPAMAQFAGGGSSSSSSTGDNENYQRIQVGYDALFEKGGSMHGAAAGYTYGLNLSSDRPLYLEFGGRLNFGSGNKITIMSISVPVNIAYKFNVTDGIAITPYTGINFRINLLATNDGHSMFGSDSDDPEGRSLSRSNDDPDDGDWDEDWDDYYDMSARRFQMGWQIGAGVNFGKWYAGLEYGLDFIKFQKSANNTASRLNVSVGYTF